MSTTMRAPGLGDRHETGTARSGPPPDRPPSPAPPPTAGVAQLPSGPQPGQRFGDATFDVVTAFDAVQYAAEPKAAAAEPARVPRPGGRVAIGVWGDPARCETEVVFQRVRRLAPIPI